MPPRRLALLAVAAALATPAPALGLGLGRAGSAEERPPARAVLASCTRGAEAAKRTAVFQGRMRALPEGGAVRLQMRFALQAREPGRARWRPVRLPGWTAWRTSAAGVPAYVYDRRVGHLAAPGAYRALVRFRWLGDDGEVLAEARAASAACRQADLRPDLVVRDLLVLPAPRADRHRYVAVVANAGRGAAGPFSVAFAADGRAAGTAAASGLAPGAVARVGVSGRACPPGATASAEADPRGAVTETEEGDNLLTVACPAA